MCMCVKCSVTVLRVFYSVGNLTAIIDHKLYYNISQWLNGEGWGRVTTLKLTKQHIFDTHVASYSKLTCQLFVICIKYTVYHSEANLKVSCCMGYWTAKLVF